MCLCDTRFRTSLADTPHFHPFQPELAHPYEAFVEAGFELTLVSPAGGVAPLDPASVEAFKADASATSFFTKNKALWENTQPLADFTSAAETYDAIFYPGGHGPMYDLATDTRSQALVAAFAAKGKLVAAVCHGQAALVGVTLADGTPLLQGKEVTGFSNAEEDMMDWSQWMPFMLETRLDEVSGGRYVKADEPWGEKVVVAGKVITGQNPGSSKKIGEEIVNALKAYNKSESIGRD